ncbi:outer membrane receptor for ferrienterochelin and colicins [Desulfocapsa sulfexigens DSM 10523]|uniref:Outer membrane receptor for ferrienterochelin and colicins n=1 Tax=Desulfocapsa sulfexigens (strain DSM 10523 / SB164P1) TaxID=1167006 RepID=M1NBX9_DESSD|nr:TonB-dependent receptor [Desulfocapsa sulfexigens]AGF77309.1 outer membrane receptor for ferrienterochelin and colicins [Desulfocapsa sulfexigens DSM 10523]
MSHIIRKLKTGMMLSCILLISTPAALWAAEEEMLDLDLSELMEIQITSAGRKAQNLGDVAAAVYVIDQAAIHNSGATSIPEALRMAPGLQVSRMTATKWAITSRGFNGVFSNKLLVQIDGRSVYTPSYSGVYWDVQNVVLEDVERIEVIRGPGATLWGANAVNGIINIITKQSSDTQGGLVSVAAGNHETGIVSLRYGTQVNNDTYGRFYLHRHDRDSYQLLADETDAHDDSQLSSAGVRLDGDIGLQNNWTLQGDLYQGDDSQLVFPIWAEGTPLPLTVDDQIKSDGYNLLGRWQHKLSETNSWTFQAYFDVTERDETYLGQKHHTVDFDFQHHFKWTKNDIVWGLGYRNISDEFSNSYTVGIEPAEQTSELFSGFIQDEIGLFEDGIKLTLGTKVEHNVYTGVEIQPSIRLLWKVNPGNNIWTAVSRAVRTPSRVEDGGRIVSGPLPTPPFSMVSVYGNPELEAEEVIAYEGGYRYSPCSDFSVDMALFYNDYKNLTDYLPENPVSVLFVNGLEGQSYGLEISSRWKPLSWLATELSYSYINLQMTSSVAMNYGGSISELVAEGSSPEHQISLHSSMELSETLRFNFWARYVDQLAAAGLATYSTGIVVDDYVALDLNFIWTPVEQLELMLVGQNLLESDHLEFVHDYFIPATEIGQSVYAKLTWKF